LTDDGAADAAAGWTMSEDCAVLGVFTIPSTTCARNSARVTSGLSTSMRRTVSWSWSIMVFILDIMSYISERDMALI
jgi:hypothetical protein